MRATATHAGPRRDAIRSGRVVELAERTYRLRHRDGFDLMVQRGWINEPEADTGRRWVRLYQQARLIPDVAAMELERRGHGSGEMSDEADEAHARFRAVVRALQPALRGAALDLADERVPTMVHPAVVLRAVAVALDAAREGAAQKSRLVPGGNRSASPAGATSQHFEPAHEGGGGRK